MTNSAKPQWVAMGYIKGVFGIKGWVKVHVDTEYTDSLLEFTNWRLSKNQQSLDVVLEDGKIVGNELQVKFTHIHDRDQAALLRGYTIEIHRDSFEETEEDEFYWADLVGMQVVNLSNESLGKVSNLMDTGAHDILVVDGEFGRKLIPFVSQFIREVNQEDNLIIVDWGIDY